LSARNTRARGESDGSHRSSDAQITLAEAARLPIVQYDGRGPNASTLWRWKNKGVKGVRLECWNVGGRVVTTPRAVEQFVRALSAPPAERLPSATVINEHRMADLALAAEGI
jgi:hypothetical protein